MPAGRLRDYLTLEAQAQAPTGATGMTVTYTVVENVWGELRGVREGTYAEALQTSDAATHVIRIRWRARTDFDHVSADGGRRWIVRGIRDPDNRRRYLDVFATELAPEVIA